MKFVTARALLLLSIAFLINACVSQTEVSSTRSTSQTEGTVPGETVPNDVQLAPGTGTKPNANVHW